jgi:P4 family phage/plasmid primase-like protien
MTIQATKVSGMEKEEIQQKLTRICGIVEKLMNIVHKKNIIEDAKTLFYDPKFEEKLDSNISLIGFENGIYDLEHKVFRNGRPDDYVHNSTGYAFRKYSDNMLFKTNIDRFFEQILPNKSVRDFFKIALSTCISGETKEEKLYILTGSGSNGKSLTVDLMIQALGNYYMSCPITMITRKRGQSNDASPEKVRMKGKRFGVFQETDEGERINVGIMKEFTGGDKVLVRDLFKGSNEMIEFKPQMKYFLTCNQLPAVPSNDDGTWRRLRVIEFGSKFTDVPSKPNEFLIDKNLKQEIKRWGPSFMSYLINIYEKQYMNKQLIEPDEVMASTNQYKMENDFYTEFIIEKITGTDDIRNIISRDMMWETFKAWYKTNYEGKPLPKRPDLLKFMNKAIGEPGKKGYQKVIFNAPHESDEEKKNDLDV